MSAILPNPPLFGGGRHIADTFRADESLMMSLAQILVVEDDASIRDAVAEYLKRHAFDVRCAANADEMDQALTCGLPDLLILDLMLPGEDGLSICRRLADLPFPILMLSAMGNTVDRIVGLEMGAADYLPKPFDPRELLARVRSILRRPKSANPDLLETFAFDGFRFTPAAACLLDPSGRPIELTTREVGLLDALTRNAGRILDRAQLVDRLYAHAEGPFERAIDLAVSRLRSKLAQTGFAHSIETVRGLGYMLRAEVVVE